MNLEKIFEDLLINLGEKKNQKKINFNVANLGNLPLEIVNNIREFEKNFTTPNISYQIRDHLVPLILSEVATLHPNNTHTLYYTGGSTLSLNILLLQISNLYQKKLNILTSLTDHDGVVLPSKSIGNCFFWNNNLQDTLEKLKHNRVNIDLLIISDRFYVNGNKNDIKKAKSHLNNYFPKALLIQDLAQSFSVFDINFSYSDICFSSAHKWLCGRNGTGFIWVSKKIDKELDLFELYGSQASFNKLGIPGGSDLLGCIENYIALKYRNESDEGYGKFSDDILEITEGLISNHNECFYIISTKNIKNPYKTYKKILSKGLDIKYIKSFEIFRITLPYFLSNYEIQLGIKVLLEVIRE